MHKSNWSSSSSSSSQRFLEQVMDMGFYKDEASRALYVVGDDSELAV